MLRHEAAIDLREAPPQQAPRRRGREDGGVPVKLGLGKGASFETTVSRQDAGRMGHTFLGGILVALGVFVCAHARHQLLESVVTESGAGPAPPWPGTPPRRRP